MADDGTQKTHQLKGRRGGCDERGFSQVSYLYLLVGYDDSDALQFAPSPAPVAIPPTSVTFDEAETSNNELQVWVHYKGIAGTGDPDPTKTQYLCNGEWREEPIETFPDQALLASKYGAQDDGTGRIKFPQYLPAQQAGSFGADPDLLGAGGANATGGGTPNPLYGVDTYPVRMQVAQKAYVCRALPSTLGKPGDVLDDLPDDFPDQLRGNGPYIVDNPEIRSGGNAFEVVERFKSINKLQHLEALYDLLQASDGNSSQ